MHQIKCHLWSPSNSQLKIKDPSQIPNCAHSPLYEVSLGAESKGSTVSPERVDEAFCRVLDPGCSGHWQSGMLNCPCSFSQCWRTADSIAWRNVYPLDLMSGILMRFIGAERAMPPLPPRLKFELQSYCSCLLTQHTSLCLSVCLSQTLNAPHFYRTHSGPCVYCWGHI